MAFVVTGCIPALDERVLVENGCVPVSTDPITQGMTRGAMLGEAYAVASRVDEAIAFVAAEIVASDEWGIWAIDDRPGTSGVSRVHSVDDTAAAWSTDNVTWSLDGTELLSAVWVSGVKGRTRISHRPAGDAEPLVLVEGLVPGGQHRSRGRLPVE